KVVIEASGFQDTPANLYPDYLVPNWPQIQVNVDSGGIWGYGATGNVAAQPAENRPYYSGAWMFQNIVSQGPLRALEYTYNHGPAPANQGQFHGTAFPDYSMVSEGDNDAFMSILNTGLFNTDPAGASPDRTWGSWGGRRVRSTAANAPNE